MIAPKGFVEFFRGAFPECVGTAMNAGATKQEAEDATDKALTEMLLRWHTIKPSLAYARKATVNNFIKDKMRGTGRVAQRMVERGHVLRQEGAEDSHFAALEDEEWVAWALSSLPSAQREIMELIAKGLTRDEIAKELGKTNDAIRQNICAARKRLFQELNPDGERRQDPALEHQQQQSRRMARAPREEAR